MMKRLAKEWGDLLFVLAPFLLIGYFIWPEKTEEDIQRDEARERVAEEKRVDRYWLEQIENGSVSFSEAACIHEQGGEWDFDNEYCDRRSSKVINPFEG